ncbi:MAG: sigma-70 family RNA polymerase sigma factor [Deltaproteobacteria bacterium]|nr:sigma-70 family RNA polymerase sigma factor [Deltaproteobacteria bacterium]
MLQGLGIKEILDEWATKYFPLTLWLAKQQQKRLPSGVEELDDLRGEASLALISCLHRYDPSRGTPLSAWVSLRVRGALITYIKRRVNYALHEDSLEEEGVASLVDRQTRSEIRDPAREVELTQMGQHFLECFAALSPQERLVLRMRFAGAIYESIAPILGVSLPTAQRWGQAALSKIVDCLQKKDWQI